MAATKIAKRKRSAGGQFVGKGAAKPSLAELVDGRLVALESAIGKSVLQTAEAANVVEQSFAKVQGEVARGLTDLRDGVDHMIETVGRVPLQAATAAESALQRHMTEGQKQLHRRVRVIVSDSVGVQMTDSTHDLSANEELKLTVGATEIWASTMLLQDTQAAEKQR